MTERDKDGIPITGMPGVKKVGNRLPGVNIGSVQSRLLKGESMDETVDEIVRQVQEAGKALPEQAGHVPAIGALTAPGAWGVFCLRCSGDAGDYIYPCPVDNAEWPPQVLYEAAPSLSE